MKGFDMGYERELIVEFRISNDYSFSRETLREMLLENPAVTDVTFSGYSIASETKMPWGRSYNDEPVEVECLPVDRNFISFFGLVYFETQFRRKEIAVRRVHGASVAEILTMINRYYLTITLICFILTAPVSFIIIRKWVSSFPYQSPVPVWIFIAALALTAAVTAVTVTLCSRRAALRNPVESISNE